MKFSLGDDLKAHHDEDPLTTVFLETSSPEEATCAPIILAEIQEFFLIFLSKVFDSYLALATTARFISNRMCLLELYDDTM